jgi:hypothetical protein
MRIYQVVLAILSLFCLAQCGSSQTTEEALSTKDLRGAYFGQERPGRIPMVFAPGMVSKPDYHEHSSPIFSRDGQEIYWSAQCMYEGSSNHRIFFSKVEDGRWTTPEVVEFTRQQHGGNPVFSPDGKRLYFHSCRPKPFNERFGNMSIWYVERDGDGWGEPVKLGMPINSGHSDSSPYLLADGTIYFSSSRPGGNGENDIYRSRFVSGRFTAPEHLGGSINTKDSEFAPCVALDESYMVLSRYSEQPKGVQLYVSFRRPDGSWTAAAPMGARIELCKKARLPGLSPDGKYLFFCAYQNRDVEVYWVDAVVINIFKPIGNRFQPSLLHGYIFQARPRNI